MVLKKFLGNSSKKVTTVGESGEIPHFCIVRNFLNYSPPCLIYCENEFSDPETKALLPKCHILYMI